jgi:hypothetical protein
VMSTEIPAKIRGPIVDDGTRIAEAIARHLQVRDSNDAVKIHFELESWKG